MFWKSQLISISEKSYVIILRKCFSPITLVSNHYICVMMKCNITKLLKSLLFIFSLCSFTNLYCQEYSWKAGVTISSLKNQGTFNVMPGIQFGGGVKLAGNEPLTFKIETLITQKGSNNWNRSNLRNVNLFYLEVPLMFNWEILSGYHIHLGFSPALLLLGNYRYKDGGLYFSNWINRDSKILDYSTFIGLDIDWTDNVSFGIRYNHSWVPIQGVNGQLYREGSLPLSRTIQIYVSHKLRRSL